MRSFRYYCFYECHSLASIDCPDSIEFLSHSSFDFQFSAIFLSSFFDGRIESYCEGLVHQNGRNLIPDLIYFNTQKVFNQIINIFDRSLFRLSTNLWNLICSKRGSKTFDKENMSDLLPRRDSKTGETIRKIFNLIIVFTMIYWIEISTNINNWDQISE